MRTQRIRKGSDSQGGRSGGLYGPEYFKSHCGPIPYDRSQPHWLQFFGTIAEEIVRALRPRQVLDVGCAKGFLVECLRDRGVEAYGFDISDYAISEVRPDIRPYCWVGSATDPIKGRYDLIACIEVLEHVPEREALLAIRNMARHAHRILFSSTPCDFAEPTHQTVRPIIWWLRNFARYSFAPDWLFDAGFAATWAFLLQETREPIADVHLTLFARHLDLKLRLQKTEQESTERIQTLKQAQQGLGDKDKHIRNIEAGLKQAQQALEDKDKHIRNIEAALDTREGEKRVIGRRLGALEIKFDSQHEELARIQGSVSWKAVERFWAWSMYLFPFDTWRRRAYNSTVGAMGRMLFGRSASLPGGVPAPLGRAPVAQETARPLQPTKAPQGEIRIHCDEPQHGDGCAGALMFRGWAVAKDGVQRIEIQVDGQFSGEARYGQARPDVAAAHPDFVNSDSSGFYYIWDSNQVTDGPHTITIVAETNEGEHAGLDVPVTVDQKIRHREFDRWISKFEPSEARLKEMAEEALKFPYRPLVSVVVPVYRTPVKLLRACMDSVRNQIYSNWELCLADDGSKNPELTQLLQQYSSPDSRIRFTELPANEGISAATNAALILATGEFVGLLDHDDELSPDALYWVVKLLQEHRDADVIYSDEDKLDLAGNRFDPFFKPDWSPDLILSYNYVCHFLVIRHRLVREVGGYRSEYDGSQDYDIILRLSERTKHIHRIPRILYHWRAVETSTALSPAVTPRAHTAAERAIVDYLKRNNIRGHVEEGCAPGRWIVRYEVTGNPKVSVIIPTGGNMQLLRPCLESVLSKTDYPNYDILLVDNSKGSEVGQFAASLSKEGWAVQYLDYRGKKFNFSSMNNFAAKSAASPMLLFLNDDTTVVNRDWLTALVEHGQRPAVGAVGAKLVYPSGIIQHAGVIMGVYKNTGHAFKGIPDDSKHYFSFPEIIRNYSAVTAACMLTRKTVFQEMRGFDEVNLPVAFQDVDYCLRLSRPGYRIVYTPVATLVHHEAVTKDEKIPSPEEVHYMQTKWADVIANDPFYNPNLTRKAVDYSLRWD